MKKFLGILFSMAILISTTAFIGCGSSDDTTTALPKPEDVVDFVLEVEEGRDAVILQLADIQIIDSSQCRYDGRLTAASMQLCAPDKMESLAFSIMRAVVDEVKPDLIVLSGDNMYGEFDDNGTVLLALIEELDSYDIPWTLTYGNHDNESAKGVLWQNEQLIKSKNCLFTRGAEEAEGNGNFTVGIVQGGKLTEAVYLMDTHGCVDVDQANQVTANAGVYKGQMEWFERTAQKLKEFNGGKNLPSIGFFHHPPKALGMAMQSYGYVSTRHGFQSQQGDSAAFQAIVIPQNSENSFGTLAVDPVQFIDQTFKFTDLLEEYEVEGWFFGHDHRNNVSVAYNGVRYTYGLKASRYDSYTESDLGGTKILVGNGLKVSHVYYKDLK